MATLLTWLGVKPLLSYLANFVIWFALRLGYLAARFTSQANHLAARLIAEARRLTFSVFALARFVCFFLSTQSRLKFKTLNVSEPSIEQVSTTLLYGKGLGLNYLAPEIATPAYQKNRVFNRAAFYAVVVSILRFFGESVSGSAARLKTLCFFAPLALYCLAAYTARG